MYCARCGVELQKGIGKCPLCGLREYHPDIREEPEALPYPVFRPGAEKRSFGWMLIITAIMLIPMVLCFAIDLRIGGSVSWSGFAAGGILTGYLCFLFPLWFRKRRPVIFLPVGMTSVLLLLLYICRKTGGKWFLPFAFPVWGMFTAILITVVVLLQYAVKGKKHRASVILGGGIIATGGLCILIEFLIRVTFGGAMLWWSFIPFAVLLVIGILMILIGTNAALRRSLHKRFFI